MHYVRYKPTEGCHACLVVLGISREIALNLQVFILFVSPHLKVVSPNCLPHCHLAFGSVAFTMKAFPRFPLQLIFFNLDHDDKATCYRQAEQESEKSPHFAALFRRLEICEKFVKLLGFLLLLCTSV